MPETLFQQVKLISVCISVSVNTFRAVHRCDGLMGITCLDVRVSFLAG